MPYTEKVSSLMGVFSDMASKMLQPALLMYCVFFAAGQTYAATRTLTKPAVQSAAGAVSLWQDMVRNTHASPQFNSHRVGISFHYGDEAPVGSQPPTFSGNRFEYVSPQNTYAPLVQVGLSIALNEMQKLLMG